MSAGNNEILDECNCFVFETEPNAGDHLQYWEEDWNAVMDKTIQTKLH